MSAPIPVVDPIADLSELPVGGTVALTCDGSTSLPGATYQWTLIEKPPLSNAALTNANTATPTLTNVDQRGTYIVFLKITDSGGSSHAYPYPVQASTAPYGFTTPLATAFGVVRVAEASTGLFKPGRGEYGWFEKGLWPIVDKLEEGLSFPYYDIPTRTLTANAIVPDATVLPENGVSFNGLRANATETAVILTEADGGQIYIASETIVTGTDLSVVGGVLKADEINDASGGDLKLSANAALLMYGGTQALVEAPDEVMLSASSNIVRVSPTESKLSTGDNFVSVRDSAEIEPDVLITAGATGADVVVSAAAEVRLSAGTDITLATTSTDGDIALTTQGATGNITVSTSGYIAGINVSTSGTAAGISLTTTGASADISINAKDDLTLATTGGDGDITLSAPGASSSIALTATNGITVTSTGDTVDAHITLTSAQDIAVYATGMARLSGTTTEVIGADQLSLITDDGSFLLNIGGDAVNDTVDRTAQVTFATDNKRRIVDIDGYVSQRNHRLTAGGTVTQVTPNGTMSYVPLRDGVTASYPYEALCGPSLIAPDFAMHFHAAFTVTQFTTSPSHYLTIELRLGSIPLSPSTIVTLASFTFQPGGSIEVTAQPCIISGTIHSLGGKLVYTAATASLQLSSAAVSTLLSSVVVDASVAMDSGANEIFAFFADSNDSNAIIGNLSASFTLMRGS